MCIKGSGRTFGAVPLNGLQINTFPPFLLIANKAVLAGAVQFFESYENVLGILHGTQTIGMVTIQMGKQHVVKVGRLDVHCCQLFIDSLAKRDLPLVYIIQYTRAETLNLSRLVVDSFGRYWSSRCLLTGEEASPLTPLPQRREVWRRPMLPSVRAHSFIVALCRC